MESDNWLSINYLTPDDFSEYLKTLPEDERSIELAQFSKRYAKKILKEGMKASTCFYQFIQDYSSRDFKIINGKPHVSQRVIIKHVKYWNDTHPYNHIRKLRIFFY
jgi:hypothetical protein